MAELIVSQAGGEALRFALVTGEITVGRAPDSNIVLDDPTISSRHAVFMLQDGGFIVRDLQSSNGMKVNNSRVAEARLTNGDRIRFGAVQCTFQEVPTATAVSPSSSPAGQGKRTLRSVLHGIFSGPSWICPCCRSDDLKTVSSWPRISVSGDRLCRACGASWSPPISKPMATVMLVLFFALGAMSLQNAYSQWKGGRESRAGWLKLQQSLDSLKSPTPQRSQTASSEAPSGIPEIAMFLFTGCFLEGCALACIPVLLGKSGKMKIHQPGNR